MTGRLHFNISDDSWSIPLALCGLSNLILSIISKTVTGRKNKDLSNVAISLSFMYVDLKWFTKHYH